MKTAKICAVIVSVIFLISASAGAYVSDSSDSTYFFDQCTNDPDTHDICSTDTGATCVNIEEDNTCSTSFGIPLRQNTLNPRPSCFVGDSDTYGSQFLSIDIGSGRRYACYTQRPASIQGKKYPLLVFFHGTSVNANWPYTASHMANRGVLETLWLSDDPAVLGYHLLSLQSRTMCIPGGALGNYVNRWESTFYTPDVENPDMDAADKLNLHNTRSLRPVTHLGTLSRVLFYLEWERETPEPTPPIDNRTPDKAL